MFLLRVLERTQPSAQGAAGNGLILFVTSGSRASSVAISDSVSIYEVRAFA